MKSRRRTMKGSMVGDMISMGVGNLVAIPLIGASATQVAALPAGTTRDIAGMAVGMQSAALLGHNVGHVKRSFRKSKIKF
jgi:hypothetical protein